MERFLRIDRLFERNSEKRRAKHNFQNILNAV